MAARTRSVALDTGCTGPILPPGDPVKGELGASTGLRTDRMGRSTRHRSRARIDTGQNGADLAPEGRVEEIAVW
jgi:hypothetical protein